MAKFWSTPAPIIIVNDDTGSFIKTDKLICVVAYYGSLTQYKSEIILDSGVTGGLLVKSPLTPKEIYSRMFSLYNENEDTL